MAQDTTKDRGVLKDVPTPDKMVSDEFREWTNKGGWREGPVVGKTICAGPFEMEMVLDYTGLRGSGSNIFQSWTHQIPKWDYYLTKVDEWIEVTPTWAEFYNITIGQKQKLEATIKQGLTSAAQSVADFELLKHDMRRYREILDYFVKAHGVKDEHVLRSLFVDRVDAHTGEGYSMITMAKRWPTIITDFIRMKSEWNDRGTIRKELDVSDAEATVLMTKNQLYMEWKHLFLPEVKDRVSRLEVLVESRKRSIDEYRKWLRPYVARFKMIREKAELKPAQFMSDPYLNPGFVQSEAETGVRMWMWKPFYQPQKGKPEAIPEKRNRGFVIDPYDDLVREWQEKIEKRYDVNITETEVNKLLKEATAKPDVPGTNPQMKPETLYYVFFDARVVLLLVRTPPPEGMETDNLMFYPLKTWVMSQNALLIHLLEIYAKEKAFGRSINTLIGSTEAEEEALERIEKEFNPAGKGKEKRKQFRNNMSVAKKTMKPPLDAFFHLFVKRGPYEPIFNERVSKMYARGIGGYYGQMTSFIMKKMRIE